MAETPDEKSPQVKRGVTGRMEATLGPVTQKTTGRNLFVTPREFLEEVARPNVEDFLASSDDARRAFNAIAAVDALAAHIYSWCKGNSKAAVSGIKDDSDY